MEKEQPPEKNTGQSFWELVRFVILLLVFFIPIRLFIIQPFVVSGSSMIPTFEDGNYLIVDEISYRLNDPKRYDVVIFKFPDPNPDNPTKFFIKRIIGLPNETVDIKGSIVTITNEDNPNGFELDQPYVKNESENNTHYELKENEYFVMGDNRGASSDSRYWGAVPRKLLIGKAFLRLWPINNIGVLPGEYVEVK